MDLIDEEQNTQLKEETDYLKKIDDDAKLEQVSEEKSSYEKCRDGIEKLIKYLKINILEQNNLYQRLRDWINSAHNDLPFFELIGCNEDPMAIWQEIIKTKS